MINRTARVCKRRKKLHSLKQAARILEQTLTDLLRDLGFRLSNYIAMMKDAGFSTDDIDQMTKCLKPSPYMNRWWNADPTVLRKAYTY